jgi:hypothetical protein
MSDFLHNLRTGNLKRLDRPRKNYDNPQNRNQNDRNYGKDRKGNYHKKVHTGDQLQEIKKQLEIISQTTGNTLKAQEKAAAALERIAAALETAMGIKPVVPALATVAAEPPAAKAPQAPEPAENAAKKNTAPENDLLSIIREMRDSGNSFDKIAAELEKRELPTVSGRGKWRGQAVSKLLKNTA